MVCWGGHSISVPEYNYTKKVGYELGLRGLDVCTGCGPGAMKGPMKGATIGHAKQRITTGRYIGITEPGIIAAESPNPIVNQLVIMPDIEKRLEAFVRLAHGIVVFPGGVGTAEEILYLLGILLDPRNDEQVLPVVLTGPEQSAGYFEQIGAFLAATLGPEALDRIQVIVDDPAEVAKHMVREVSRVRSARRAANDSYNFNWLLQVPDDFQRPFDVTHASMRALKLHRDQPKHLLVANLRRAFSGIVAGNVKEKGVAAIEREGPFELQGDPAIMTHARRAAALLRHGRPHEVARQRLQALLPHRALKVAAANIRRARPSACPLRDAVPVDLTAPARTLTATPQSRPAKHGPRRKSDDDRRNTRR